MASLRFLIASAILFLCSIHLVESYRSLLEPRKLWNKGVQGMPINVSAAAIQLKCGDACAVRCGESSRPNLCKRACGTCCTRCNCVPPGTYGNYDSCACYADMKTRGGANKCP